MALYDNYRQSNSSYISQFAGSIVPEVAGFVGTMKNRYEEAAEQDDMLFEAMGNMVHLSDEADTLYANELKQDYANKMAERVQKGDYENMGRRTKRDARNFVTDYKPLANRLQAFQTIQQRVMNDENIVSPEKKNQILGYIQTINNTPKNPDGTYIRDDTGKVSLKAIQDWAYAKDVDVDKRLVDLLKEVETELTQQGFTPDGQGLMVSAKNEVRTKEDMAQMAMDRMRTDPEIAAMLKRDALLQTYNIQGPALDAEVSARNRSKYDELVSSGLKPDQIKQLAVNSGLEVSDLKIKPYDMIAQSYNARGLSPEQAKRDFLRVRVEEELKVPHADMVSNILKVDKSTLEARQDPTFAAKLKHQYDKKLVDYEATLEKAEIIQQFIDEPNAETINFVDLNNEYTKANEAYMEAVDLYKNDLGTLLNNKPTISADFNANKDRMTQWNNEMNMYLNNPSKQAELLNSIRDTDTKNQVQSLFNRHNQALGTFTETRQSFESIPQSVYDNAVNKAWEKVNKDDVAKGYKVYKNKAEFAEWLKKTTATEIGSGPLGVGYKDRNKGALDWYGRDTDTFIREMNKGVKESRGRTQTPISVFEPYGSGYVADQTRMFTDLAAAQQGSFTDKSGNSIKTYIDEYKDDNKDWTEADQRIYYNNMRVRMSDKLASSGNPQFVVTLPDGSTKVFENSSFGPNKGREMAARMMQSSAHSYSDAEYNYQVSNVARSLSQDEFLYTNPVMLDNARKGQVVDVNDKYAYKIVTSKRASGNGTLTTGNLVIKNPQTGKYEEIKDSEGNIIPQTQNLTIEGLQKTLGAEVFNNLIRP